MTRKGALKLIQDIAIATDEYSWRGTRSEEFAHEIELAFNKTLRRIFKSLTGQRLSDDDLTKLKDNI